MRRYDYSFLKQLPLPDNLSSLHSAVDRLNLLFRLAHSPQGRGQALDIEETTSVQETTFLTDTELPGYGEALQEIYRSYQDMEFSLDTLLQIHRLLLPEGHRPTAEETLALDQIVSAYHAVKDEADSLLLIPCVTLDLLCAAPFQAGSQGVALLASRLLMCRSGYELCRYFPLEREIHRYLFFYERALAGASAHWDENANAYLPYIEIFISMIYLAGRQALTALGGIKLTKRAKIEALVLSSQSPISKAEICSAFPEISPTTVEAVLGAMVKSGSIRRIGAGRGTRYLKA